MRDARQRSDGPVLPLGAPVELCVVDGGRDPPADEAQHGAVVILVSADAGGLHVDDADQPLADDHGHAQLAAHKIGGAQITRVGLDIRAPESAAGARPRSHHAFAERQRKVAHHLFAMPHRIANAQVFSLLVEQQNGEKIVRNDAAHDRRHVGEQLDPVRESPT